MNRLMQALLNTRHIESLALQDSFIHRQSACVKMTLTLMMLICVLSEPLHHPMRLMLYVLIVLLACLLARIPIGMIVRRTLLGLPFSLCIALSNVLLVRTPVVYYGMHVTLGLLMGISVLLKTALCLSFVFYLMATTTLQALTGVLLALHVPDLFVMGLTMTYRYLFLLVEEAHTMNQAYHLRGMADVTMHDMGSFVGSLMVRAMQRAQDVDDAMTLRGFDGSSLTLTHEPVASADVFLSLMLIGLVLVLKVVLR